MRRGIQDLTEAMKAVLRMICVVLINAPYVPRTLLAISKKWDGFGIATGDRGNAWGFVMAFGISNSASLMTASA
jgi:hypothetical protein